jgi:hypothetical protein
MISSNPLTSDVLERITPEQAHEIALVAAGTELGLSAVGLIRWAAKGGGDIATYTDLHPADDGDLGRCESAYEKAPRWLQENMFPLLVAFRVRVFERNLLSAFDNPRLEEEYSEALKEAREHFLTKKAESRTATLTQAQWSIVRRFLWLGLNEEQFEGEDDLAEGGFTFEEAHAVLGIVRAFAC